MKLFGKMKIFLVKYIRKYTPVIFTLFFIPIFSISTFAIQPIDGSYVDSFILTTYSGQNRELLMRFGPSFSADYWADLNSANCYVYDNAAESVVNSITFGTSNTGFEFEYLPSLYDYYIFLRVHSNSVSSNNDFTFYPTMAGVYYYDDMTSSQVWSVLTDLSVETYNDKNQLGFQFCGKLNAINSAQFNYLRVVSNNGSVPADLEVEGLIVAVDKSQNSSTQSIVTAINNQTSSLGGKLDGIDSGIQQGNDLVENGNSNTDDVVENFNEIFEDFNAELSRVDEFEADIVDEFNTANDAYLTELNNFSLTGSLMNASSWLSTSMQRVYNHSSDYKMLWLVPLLFGIPVLLFVIKRGKEEE